MNRTMLITACALCAVASAAEPPLDRTLRSKVDGVSRCLLGPKGGVGIVAEETYVLTTGDLNTILFAHRPQWVGHRWDVPELVVVYDGTVYRPADLPIDFDLSRGLTVSFEPGKVRAYSFAKRSGCYYLRSRDRTTGTAR